MKLDTDTADRRARKLLLIAQLLALAYFALGLAFACRPTAGNLFLFTVLSPVLAPGALILFATQSIAARQRRRRPHVVVPRARKTIRRSHSEDQSDLTLIRPVSEKAG